MIWYLPLSPVAIAKGMAWREEKKLNEWSVPYLPVDPMDVGRTYDSDVIRINSQSGKGGVNYILKQNFGISLPEKMREEVGYLVKHVSDEEHKELSPQWVYEIFEDASLTSRLKNATSNRWMVLWQKLLLFMVDRTTW